jgi:hypothetical protein
MQVEQNIGHSKIIKFIYISEYFLK